MIIQWWRARHERKEARGIEEAVKDKLARMAKDPSAFDIDPPGTVTGVINDVKHAVEEATESKKKARSSAQRILDLLPGRKKGG
jgi:hypothetical protein